MLRTGYVVDLIPYSPYTHSILCCFDLTKIRNNHKYVLL